jgi:hypothetical protein
MVLLRRTAAEVEKTLALLSKVEFSQDPLVHPKWSRAASIISSAYKRHGFILEHAVLERLQMCQHLKAWDHREFSVPSAADHVVESGMSDPSRMRGIEHPYTELGPRTIQIDAIVYYPDRKHIAAYEIKRGMGLHDAGKRRSMLRDLLCTQILLKSYARTVHGLEVATADSQIIFYYGARSLPAPFSMTRDDLDAHFGTPVVDAVEEVNSLFGAELNALLERIDGGDAPEADAPPEEDVIDLSADVETIRHDASTAELPKRHRWWHFGKRG